MLSYKITLPRNVKVDIFNLPENFKEIVEGTFRDYTEGTAKNYMYCDKLGYIDALMMYINNSKYTSDVINDMVKDYMTSQWDEFGKLVTEDDIYCFEFMENCYSKGIENARLYSHYGLSNHHIYDQIQKVIVQIITIVMNYRERVE